MARKKNATCYVSGCEARPHLGGLCEVHHEEKTLKDELRSDAVRLLHHSTVDGFLPKHDLALSELLLIQRWWTEVCSSLNYRIPHPILRDEVEFASDWCIALAEQLVLLERRRRSGVPDPESDFKLVATQEWVWHRFTSLEKGLTSNGVAGSSR
jgi:hypothetical protein